MTRTPSPRWGSAYLRLSPPEADKALTHLNHALQVSEASQRRIAGDKRLHSLTPVYEASGDGYYARASQLSAVSIRFGALAGKEGSRSSVLLSISNLRPKFPRALLLLTRAT